MIRICLIGDYNPEVTAHQAIPRALALAADGNVKVEPVWLGTEHVRGADLAEYDGFWCVPASPYRSMDGALHAIRFAREQEKPFLGTCGGCQHAILEFARNVIQLTEAGHEETEPAATELVVTRLACSLIEADENLQAASGRRLREIYGVDEFCETYRCNFGLNPDYIALLVSGGLRIGATGRDGEVRAMELPTHPFFFLTLFQPERSALKSERHPLIAAFAQAASRWGWPVRAISA